MALCGKAHQALLIPAQREPLIEQAVDLALQFPRGPIVLDRLDFVEGANSRLLNP